MRRIQLSVEERVGISSVFSLSFRPGQLMTIGWGLGCISPHILSVPLPAFWKNFNFYCLFRKRFSSAYLLKRFLLPQRVYIALFIRCDKTESTRWCLCSLYAGIQISPDEVVGSCDSSPFHRRRHSWCAHTSLPANFQCSHRVVLVPFCIICSLHLIAVAFLQAIWLPEWSLQLPSFLAFMSPGDAQVHQILP